ncbi:MAG TPA: 16S rRNA (cytosine(967)-C(5))-methyltransferase RsmB [Chroococcales cyanobacterium]
MAENDPRQSVAGKSASGKSGAGKSGSGKSGSGKSGAGKSGSGTSGAVKSGAGKSGAAEKNGVPAGNTQKPGLSARKLALEILIKVDSEGAYANLSLNQAFKRKTLSQQDRAFVTALVQGVVRSKLKLDGTLSKFSSRPLDKMPASLVNVLRLAVFQIDEMTEIPHSAVLNTSNDLARLTGNAGHPKFVNGVLRSYLRCIEANGPEQASNDESSQISAPLSPAGQIPSTAQALSLRYSMPEWIVERWLGNFGAGETEQLLAFANKPPQLVLRTCEMSITTEGLIDILKAKKIAVNRGRLVPSCLIVEKRPAGPPEKMMGYSEGLYSFQDEAAAFVSLCAEPQKGETIVDLCAAPGGKALHMGELMENTGRVVAVDVSEKRLGLIKKNRTRLALTNIETVVADGRQYQPAKPADRVLLDAPCTGTGVIGRRSDLRYRRQPEDIRTLAELQKELLSNAAAIVKPGGLLIYATCSLEPEENFDNVRWFLKEHQNFEGDSLLHLLSSEFRSDMAASEGLDLSEAWKGPMCKTEPEMARVYMIQLMPSRHGVSGFFVARLRRKD